MARPIKLTEEFKQKAVERFVEEMDNTRMQGGKIDYSDTFVYDDERKATVVFSGVAFAKMLMLVHHFSKEVAWHGVCTRDDEDASKFYISDILVYPQTVTGVTVDMDQKEYSEWIAKNALDDDRFCNLRFQGHSHVNMGVSPSGEDLHHQSDILDQLPDDGFYIFAIVNKSLSMWFNVFDLRENVVYETGEISVCVDGCNVNMVEFLKEADDMVKTCRPAASVPYSGYRPNVPIAKSKPKRVMGVSDYDSLDDYYEEFYRQGGIYESQ